MNLSRFVLGTYSRSIHKSHDQLMGRWNLLTFSQMRPALRIEERVPYAEKGFLKGQKGGLVKIVCDPPNLGAGHVQYEANKGFK